MISLKNQTPFQYDRFTRICISCIFSTALLLVRIQLTGSLVYLFLIWNLFLAMIPFGISTVLSYRKSANASLFISFGSIWIAFLPNAPYIITDLIHLKRSSSALIWLDVLLVLAFALTGLLLFYSSVIDMTRLFEHYFNKKINVFITLSLMFLSAFGIYLGRFLRYNSWEIIQNPIRLFKDITQLIFNPTHHTNAWLFTALMGTFLAVGYWWTQVKYTSKTY